MAEIDKNSILYYVLVFLILFFEFWVLFLKMDTRYLLGFIFLIEIPILVPLIFSKKFFMRIFLFAVLISFAIYSSALSFIFYRIIGLSVYGISKTSLIISIVLFFVVLFIEKFKDIKQVRYALIILLILLLIPSIEIVYTKFMAKYQTKTFNIEENAILGLTNKKQAYKNCMEIKVPEDPTSRLEASRFKHSCFLKLAIITKDRKMCPGGEYDYSNCLIKIASENNNASLCYEHERIKDEVKKDKIYHECNLEQIRDEVDRIIAGVHSQCKGHPDYIMRFFSFNKCIREVAIATKNETVCLAIKRDLLYPEISEYKDQYNDPEFDRQNCITAIS